MQTGNKPGIAYDCTQSPKLAWNSDSVDKKLFGLSRSTMEVLLAHFPSARKTD